MKRNIFWFLILAVCLIQTAWAQAPAAGGRGYLIGPGDEIKGRVMSEGQFDFDATVDENGNIEVPFADKPISVMCHSESQLKADVVKTLSKYIRTPQVSILVTRKSRPPAVVSGEVRTPAQVDLRRRVRLMELIAFSGGVTDDAEGMIEIFRPQPPMCAQPNEIAEWNSGRDNGLDVPSKLYSLTDLKLGKDDANPVIYPGDLIVVKKATPVYIVGEVRQPQGLFLKEGGTTLTEAIAKIGGINREAKTKDITIRRLKPNSKEREIISVNYDQIKKGKQKDVMLMAYDIVEVDKAKKSIGQTILEIATGAAKTGVGSLSGGIGTRILY